MICALLTQEIRQRAPLLDSVLAYIQVSFQHLIIFFLMIFHDNGDDDMGRVKVSIYTCIHFSCGENQTKQVNSGKLS